ncbi:hypothetical protein NJ7G_1072 [Natrinema sp. J7-2]|nr:hypothetical protein NJ7G_1072 [Natrinema sp. J7-2]
MTCVLKLPEYKGPLIKRIRVLPSISTIRTTTIADASGSAGDVRVTFTFRYDSSIGSQPARVSVPR